MSKVRSRPESQWQTVPCTCCSYRKGEVAECSPTSRRHLQCRGVSRAKTTTSDDLWRRPQAVRQVRRCYAMPEHTTGTWFAPERVTSEAAVSVELCVLTSGASREAERRHSARTDCSRFCRYTDRGTHKGPSYTDPTWWWLVFRSVSAGRAEGETVARYGSGAVLQNTLTVLVTWVLMVMSASMKTPRSRAAVTGDTKASPTRTGPVGIWCWRRDHAHQRTSVLAGFSCSRFAFIHAETSSMQTDSRCVRRLRVAVNLAVVCIRMRREMITLTLTSCRRSEVKPDRSEDQCDCIPYVVVLVIYVFYQLRVRVRALRLSIAISTSPEPSVDLTGFSCRVSES